MERILAIAADEDDYAEELAAYLSGRQDFIFRPVVFTDDDAYMRYTADRQVDMLLVSEARLKPGLTVRQPGHVCILAEDFETGEDGIPRVFKYQSADRIMRDLVNIYAGRYPAQNVSERREKNYGRMICVCSPVGGSYKSTFALALASYFSRGGRTLFLSLDPFFTVPRELKRSSDLNVTDVLYFLETYGREPAGLVERVARRYGNLDHITGVSHWFDVCDIKPENMQRLLNAIEHSGCYEHVVLDVGFIGPGCIELLSASESVYVPVGRGISGRGRIDEWKRQLGFIGRDSLISGMREMEVPFDETLAGEYTFDQLLKGRIGEFIEETEGLCYLKS